MNKLLFVGEKRSLTARKMGITWEDGRLAGKHLMTAIDYSGIDRNVCTFKNVFREILSEDIVNKTALKEIKNFDGVIIAMGRKVEKVLKNNNVNHLFIYHPATRGEVRNIDKYCKHFSENLKEII